MLRIPLCKRNFECLVLTVSQVASSPPYATRGGVETTLRESLLSRLLGRINNALCGVYVFCVALCILQETCTIFLTRAWIYKTYPLINLHLLRKSRYLRFFHNHFYMHFTLSNEIMNHEKWRLWTKWHLTWRYLENRGCYAHYSPCRSLKHFPVKMRNWINDS